MRIIINGKFDVLHTGHFNILNFCRSIAGLDGEVMVCIDSDERIGNPVIQQDIRKVNLMQLMWGNHKMVNDVRIFHSSDELCRIIEEFKPNYLVKGAEWIGKPITGSRLVEVIFYAPTSNGIGDKISSSKIVDMVIDRYNNVN